MPAPILVVDAAAMQRSEVLRHPILTRVTWSTDLDQPCLSPVLPICETRLPALFCTCGAYMLLTEEKP